MNDLGLIELFRGEGQRYAACGNVVIVATTTEPDLPSMQRYNAKVREFAAGHASGIAMMVLVPEESKPPSKEGREAYANSYRSMAGQLRIVVVVVEGEGFVAAAKRSAMTLINLAARLPFAIKVAPSVRAGAELVVSTLGPGLAKGLTAEHLVQAAVATREL